MAGLFPQELQDEQEEVEEEEEADVEHRPQEAIVVSSQGSQQDDWVSKKYISNKMKKVRNEESNIRKQTADLF